MSEDPHATHIGSDAYRRRLLDGVPAAVAARRLRVIDNFSAMGTDPLRSAAVLAAVDAGGDWKTILVRETAEAMGVRPPPTRILDMLAGTQRLRGGGLQNTIAIAGRLPADWLPKHHPSADSAAFLAICSDCRSFLDDQDYDHVPTLFAGCGGNWHDWHRDLVGRIADQAVTARPEPERDGLDESEEYDDYAPPKPSLADGMLAAFHHNLGFANQVVIPALMRDFGRGFEEALTYGYDIARAILLDGVRMEDVMAFSSYMARRPGDFESALYDRLTPSDAPSWKAFTAPFPHPNGLTAVPVVTAQDVLDECRAGMNPDGTKGLGNYAAASIVHAMAGKMHIYSIRSSDEPFRRHGTVVMSYEYDAIGNARYVFCDHTNTLARVRTPWPGIVIEAGLMGENDGPLGEEAMAVFRKMAVAIAERRLPIDVPPPAAMIDSGLDYSDPDLPAEVVALHDDKKPDIGTVDQLAGYPVLSRNAIEAALEAWRSHLPRNLKKITMRDVEDRISLALADLGLPQAPSP